MVKRWKSLKTRPFFKLQSRPELSYPTLCHHKDLTPYGGCRLCSVDVRGMRLPATACTLLVSPGMVVQTESPELTRYRRTILELLLVRFYDAGYTHNGSAKPELDTQFAHWVHYYGIDMKSAMAREPFRQIDSDPNPFIWVDKNKCIMCTRCVRACAEVQGRFVWTQAYRGYDLRIVAGADTTMLQARCESVRSLCGALPDRRTWTTGCRSSWARRTVRWQRYVRIAASAASFI